MNTTEKEALKMKTISGKILVSPYDLLEKRRYQLTEEVELEIENKFNKNLRERNPQTGIVRAVFDGCKDVSVGDKILINHFTFCDGNGDKIQPFYIQDGIEYYSVPYEECYFVLDEDGEVKHPIGDYLLCQHVEEQEQEQTESGIFIPQTARNTKPRDKKHLLVLHAGNSEIISVGDVIISIFQYAITINKKQYFRIKEEQVLAQVL